MSGTGLDAPAIRELQPESGPAGPAATGRSSAAAGHALSLVGSQLIAAASTFGTGVVLARALGASGKGYVDLTLASATLLQMLVGLSLASGLFYHTARGDVDSWKAVRASVVFALLLGVLAAVVLPRLAPTRVGDWLLPVAGRQPAIWLIAALLVALQGQQLLQGITKGEGRFAAFGGSEVLARGGTLMLVGGLALAGFVAPAPFVAAFLVAVVLSGALLAVGSLTRGTRVARDLPVRAIAAYSVPLYLGNLVQFLNYRLDIFFVKNFVGLGALGMYTVAVWIAQAIWLVPTALATLVMRAAAERDSTIDVAARVAAVNRLCLLLSVVTGMVVGIGGTYGIAPLFGRDFAPSVVPLLYLIPGVVLFSPTIILSGYLNGIGRQVYTTWVACGSLVVTVVLNMVLVPRIGIAGAATTSSVSYTLSSVATLLFTIRLVPALRLADLLVPRREDFILARAAARTLWSRR